MLEKQLYDVNKLTEELSRTNNKQKAEAKLKYVNALSLLISQCDLYLYLYTGFMPNY